MVKLSPQNTRVIITGLCLSYTTWAAINDRSSKDPWAEFYQRVVGTLPKQWFLFFPRSQTLKDRGPEKTDIWVMQSSGALSRDGGSVTALNWDEVDRLDARRVVTASVFSDLQVGIVHVAWGNFVQEQKFLKNASLRRKKNWKCARGNVNRGETAQASTDRAWPSGPVFIYCRPVFVL